MWSHPPATFRESVRRDGSVRNSSTIPEKIRHRPFRAHPQPVSNTFPEKPGNPRGGSTDRKPDYSGSLGVRLISVARSRVWTQHARAPSLRSVGGNLCVTYANFFAAPCRFRASRLRTVGMSLETTSATVFVAPFLGYVGRDLIAPAAIHFRNPSIKVCGEWRTHPKARRSGR